MRRDVDHPPQPRPIAKWAWLTQDMSLERVDAVDPTGLLKAVNERCDQSPEMVDINPGMMMMNGKHTDRQPRA